MVIKTNYDMELPTQTWKFNIAARLIALRQKATLRKIDVTKALGWKSGGSLNDAESGRKFLGLKKLSQLAVLYDCSIDFILLGAGWGGTPVRDYAGAIHDSLAEVAQPKPKIERVRGVGVSIKAAPLPPPPAPIKVRIAKAKPKAKVATPVAKPKAKARGRGNKMKFDFSLEE